MPALRDLTVAVLAGARVERSLRACTRVVAAGDAGADLLVAEPGLAGAAEAAEAAAAAAVPSAAWLRDPAAALALPPGALDPYDALFVSDPALAGLLEARAGRRPAPLP
ncbi:MAG TPA: hypothetical protein VF533_14560, partial [Solirubrobacteraceae bacterium]